VYEKPSQFLEEISYEKRFNLPKQFAPQCRQNSGMVRSRMEELWE
jgi:hypothetical protein